MLKRLFDILASGFGLLFLFPIFVVLSFWIKIDSPGPIFFRQERVGRYGHLFRIHKFRTMTCGAETKGLQITVGQDCRITSSGALLRKWKLDELPQLIDVFFGNMSLVGPRPEVPCYMACYPELIRERILSVRPGITDRASIEFRDENEILGTADNPEDAYIHQILPIKQRYYLDYVERRSFFGDISIIIATVGAIVRS